MNKETQNIIYAICNWVKAYNASTKETPRELYFKTKYSDYHELITEVEIEKYLQENLSLIDLWEIFSMDKRWSPSWYFTRSDSGKNVVGYFHHDDKMKKQMSFNHASKACAFFIKMEMEELRKMNG
jgi:predicted HTH domain antitoxin